MFTTYVPFPDFSMCASCLDDETLLRQRKEALDIYRLLRDNKPGWAVNPNARMWKEYLPALSYYYLMMNATWKCRGNRNTLENILIAYPVIFPPWLGNRRFHTAQQSLLLAKNEKHYRFYFGPSVPADLPPMWPL